MIKLIPLLLLFSAAAFAETQAVLSWDCPPKREDGTPFNCETELKEFVVKAATSGPIEDWEPLWIGKETITTLDIKKGVRYNFAVFAVDTGGLVSGPALAETVLIPETIHVPVSAPGVIESILIKLIFTDDEPQ